MAKVTQAQSADPNRLKPFRVDIFQCRGNAQDVGRQMAQAFLKTARGRAFARRRPRRPFAFSLANARAALDKYAPNIWQELEGLAQGLEVPIERVVGEYVNGRLRFPRRGCSAAIGAGIYARNYDFALRRYDRTLIAAQGKGYYAHIGFAERFTGRLDGMNECGLCVGLHYVNQRTWQPGLVCMLIVRMLLDQCATTDEAIALMRRTPHGLGYNYSLLDDGGHAAVVEAAPLGIAVRQGPWLACTNHFQAPAMQRFNPRATGRSRKRLPPLEKWAQQLTDLEEFYRALNDRRSPAFHHHKGWGTLHTIVCQPLTRTMLIGAGGNAAPTRVNVGDWSLGAPLAFAALGGVFGAAADSGGL